MKTVTSILFIFIVIIVLCPLLFAEDGYYYYAFGEKVDMIINREYIAVKIDEASFTTWNNIYSSEIALNDSEPPKYLTDNIFRLKVDNLEETDNLLTSIKSNDGIIETNHCFVTDDGMDYYLGKYLDVKFKEDISKTTIDSIIKVNGLNIISISKLVPSMYLLGSEDLTNPQMISLGNAIYEDGYADFGILSFITKPVMFSAQNDTFYPNQYALHSDHCDFEEAYEYTLTDDTIIVAFLDTGLEPHEDFPAERIKYGKNFILGQHPYYSSNYSLTDTCYGTEKGCFHGMATVGIFGATINNSMGIAGAVNNTQVIMNKMMDDVEVENWRINAAFDSAVDSGAVIISNSWGYNSCQVNNVPLFTKIHQAYLEGVIVIFSAGNCGFGGDIPNCGNCVFDPADHPDVIAVGATTDTGGRWAFSAYKNNEYELDVCASGHNMHSLDQMGVPGQYPPKPCTGDNNYSCMLSGTSYSAPLVSGLAAMIMAKRPDFIGHPDTIKQIIYHSTGNGWSHPDSTVEDAHTKTYQMGYGRINAARAMLAISRGNVNNTAGLDILDIAYLIDYKYKNGAEPFPNVRLADVDCSGIFNIIDITYLINYLYKDASRPPLCYKF